MSNPIGPQVVDEPSQVVDYAPDRLNTNIPSAELEEKDKPAEGTPVDEDDQDEDIDALIDELESVAGDDPEEDDPATGASARPIPEEVLNTDTRIGLTAAVVEQRRKKYGLNQMKEEKENLILKFLMYFVGPIQFVMEAAAILAAGLQDWVDFGVICALLLLNACVGFVQEFQAGSIVEELKKTLALKAVVLRDGRLTEVEAPMVVPGDILQVEEVCPFVVYFTPIYNILTSETYRVPLFLLTVALLPKMPSYKLINPLSPVNPLL
jgi:H+-transporting ATPase